MHWPRCYQHCLDGLQRCNKSVLVISSLEISFCGHFRRPHVMKPLSDPAHGKGGLSERTCPEITVLSFALPLTCAGHWANHSIPRPYLQVVNSYAEIKQPLAQRRATLTASESLVQALWKCEDILKSSKMTRRSKINSERRIYHIKHIHAEDILFIICSAFLSAAHPKAKHAAKSCILMIRGLPHFPGRWIWGHENDF